MNHAICHLAAFYLSHTNFFPHHVPRIAWEVVISQRAMFAAKRLAVSTGFTTPILSQRKFIRCKIVASFAPENSNKNDKFKI